jgi:FtsP/CotA-like multicopper oxidase with cupredoxin domain
MGRLPFIMVPLLVIVLFATTAFAAAPGITGPAFKLDAAANYISQPDGMQVYSWGYGCTVAPAGYAPFTPPAGSTCGTMQVPGPTLIVTEGQPVTVTLTNSLPTVAGNTSIIFSGFTVASSGGVAGLLAQEAVPAGTVTYTFTPTAPGTHAYYSGTQSDLQVEMGLYGAVIVLPNTVQGNCTPLGSELGGRTDYRLAPSAYDHAETCYDREYLFQFAEMDYSIHRQAELQVQAALAAGATTSALNVATEPYKASYFLINGRSMPDDMDANYAPNYPNQPYNGNPHMHPGELVLIRTIGQGRMEHPFHEHANHVRILARDGNLMVSQTDASKLAGLLMFTTDTFPGQTFDGIFYFSGRGLNWDMYNHLPSDGSVCVPDANGYYTTASTPPAAPPTFSAGVFASGARNYYEWCADHDKPLQTVNGGPATLPDPLVVTNGLWYSGSPYMGTDARNNGTFTQTPLPPGSAVQNPEAGFAFMWHSHNEREITTNDVFPGGMMMMMLVDPPVFFIDETL